MNQKQLEEYLNNLDKTRKTKHGKTREHTPPITKENAELIKSFLKNMQTLPDPPTSDRMGVLALRLKLVSHLIGNKRLDNLTEEDIKELNPKLRQKCPNAAPCYRKALKQFWRLQDEEKFLKLIRSRYMKEPRNEKKLVDAEQFWSQKEIEAYIQESKRHSPRQLAWAAIWVSSGCRPCEIFAMKKRSIEYEEPNLTIKVPDGKTGKRDVILKNQEAKAIWSYLTPYLDTLNDNDLLFPISYNMQKKIHGRICKQIELPEYKDKKFYIARKWNVTRFYHQLGPIEGAMQSGHVVGSGVVKHYADLTDKQRKGEKLVQIQKKICPNALCAQENDAHQTHCSKCQSPLDGKEYGELVKREKENLKVQMDELVSTKFQLLFAQLELKIKEINGSYR